MFLLGWIDDNSGPNILTGRDWDFAGECENAPPRLGVKAFRGVDLAEGELLGGSMIASAGKGFSSSPSLALF